MTELDRQAVWRPQPKQAALMARFEDEALYGGAAGGGKSDCALAEALRQVGHPAYRGLILRKTYPQLSELIDRAHAIYAPAFPGARYHEQKHCWTFPGGAKIFFGAMQHTADRTNYQGKRFDFIDFDELTQFTWDEYSYMFSRCRPGAPGTRCYIRAQANPGGIGHAWVKARFITPAPPLRTIWEAVTVTRPDGGILRRWRSRVFVPSTVYDNRALLDADPDYVARLAAMPEAERRALLLGDWDSFAGQVFTEWRDDPDHYADRRGSHVIDPFPVPADWAVWCAMDWGFAKPFSVGWYAVDRERRLYRIREYYGCTGVPNEGVKLEPGAVARRIREIEAGDPNLRGRVIHRVADPAIWGSDGTESIGALMERERVCFERGNNARIDGKMQVHHRLAFDGRRGLAKLYVFRTCRHFLRTVPALVYDQSNVEDVDSSQEDHIYDELRYVCMKNPIAPPPPPARRTRVWDPLG